MKEKLAQIKAEAIKQIENSRTLEQLNEVRVSQLGKKGALTEILKGMKDVAPEDRPKVGQLVNETRAEIEKVLEDSRKKNGRTRQRSKDAEGNDRRYTACQEGKGWPHTSKLQRAGRSRTYFRRYGI